MGKEDMIQDHTTSFELSKKLRELGARIDSYFHWITAYDIDYEGNKVGDYYIDDEPNNAYGSYPAPLRS